MKIKQAIHHLEKALKQTTAQNSLQVQLQQLNAKMNTLLQKKDTATNTTQKVVEKAIVTRHHQHSSHSYDIIISYAL